MRGSQLAKGTLGDPIDMTSCCNVFNCIVLILICFTVIFWEISWVHCEFTFICKILRNYGWQNSIYLCNKYVLCVYTHTQRKMYISRQLRGTLSACGDVAQYVPHNSSILMAPRLLKIIEITKSPYRSKKTVFLGWCINFIFFIIIFLSFYMSISMCLLTLSDLGFDS